MTTIAYSNKDGTVSFDSRVTAGSQIVSDNANKMKVVDGIKFIFCGVVADIDKLISSYFGEHTDESIECSCIIIKDNAVFDYSYHSGKCYLCEVNFDSSWGSGSDFAISAMDFGKTSKEAVKYASTRDSMTGGKIRTIKVK